MLSPDRVDGRSYTLFGDSPSTEGYYATCHNMLAELLDSFDSKEMLLVGLRAAARRTRRRGFHANRESRGGEPITREQQERIDNALAPFTRATEGHLSQLSFLRRHDSVLGMTRRQYHLAMLETMLVNRMQRERFAASSYRIALLPHCLRDLTRECKAERDEIEMRCRKCSQDCFIHHVSAALERHSIKPYLWMSLSRRQLFKRLREKSTSPAILGIACIPELLSGMRMCTQHKVPVLGLPLNANRCGRWMDTFHPNSIDLGQLDALLEGI